MSPEQMLAHYDSGDLWHDAPSQDAEFDLGRAYAAALQVRQLRLQRGEQARGFKIGFTNRGIWPRYKVFAPIWGTVWDTTLDFCDGQGSLVLGSACQPRIEPEAVFGMRSTPPPAASLQQLFEAIDWIAPGFEIVQSHLAEWKFAPADTVADGGLHARLMVGRKTPLAELAQDAAGLNTLLAATQLVLSREGQEVERGVGANVLDGPLFALHYFLAELRRCPAAPDLVAGDVVTTGTWTDAWPVVPGQTWQAAFGAPLSTLSLQLR